MKIAVCDDEKEDADVLKGLLECYFENSCDIDVFYSGGNLLKSNNHYEIFFLDIDIDDISGVTIAERIRETDIQAFIVFVTNYEDFYRRAFAVHAFEYIVKPIKYKQLVSILDDIQIYRKKDLQNREVCFRGVNSLVKIKISKICYFEFVDRKIKLVLDHDVVWLRGTMKELCRSMEQYDFAAPHKAYIVNMKKVQEIKRYDIIMSNGDMVPIAQKKASVFRKKFELYLYNQV